MKYLSKRNITALSVFSILLLIMVSLVLCNPSVAHYKTRIIVDTVDLKITPYLSINTVIEEAPVDNTAEDQQENSENDVISEENVN